MQTRQDGGIIKKVFTKMVDGEMSQGELSCGGGRTRGGRKEGGGKDTDSLETKEQREVRNRNLILLKTNGCTRFTYLNLFQKHDKLSSSSCSCSCIFECTN